MSAIRTRGSGLIRTTHPPHPTPPYPSAGPCDDPDPMERRIAVRSIPLVSRSSLGWWDEKTFVSFSARLADISRAGVALEMDVRPPNDRDVGFQLESQDKRERLWGEVVDVKSGRRGRHLVRIAFWLPCPEQLYREALDGPHGGRSDRASG